MLQCNCSVFGDEASGEAIVVDPGDGTDLDDLRALLKANGWRVKAIYITHGHIDHIGAAAKLKHETGAPVYMNADDRDQYEHMGLQAQWLGMAAPPRTEIDGEARDGDTLTLGGVAMHVLHTPGHTEGSTCLYVPELKTLVAGDTLFRDSIGRTDLPGGNGKMILKSIHTKLLVLDDETRVVCGHGAETTIGRERERNPFLQE